MRGEPRTSKMQRQVFTILDTIGYVVKDVPKLRAVFGGALILKAESQRRKAHGAVV